VVIGSFRMAIHYDSAALTFAGADGADTLATAVHDAGDRIMVAGASPAGFRGGGWLALTFRTRGSVRATAPRIEVLELGDLRGADLRNRILVAPAGRSPR
jgi:hypothetical protein